MKKKEGEEKIKKEKEEEGMVWVIEGKNRGRRNEKEGEERRRKEKEGEGMDG